MNKKLLVIPIGMAVVILALLGALFFVPTKSPRPVANNDTAAMISSDGHVQINSPHANDLVTSPIAITGTVTGGGWFFEGSFPIKIVDANGKVLGRGTAQAASDWTATGTVQFTAAVDFAMPSTAMGTIVLSKDNPSGLPQNDMSLTIPIAFEK